mmetsp:Transcript_12650/g.30208  ORF Transcript_12650/g.30208 Transcript_12650/m.30208 type:complete len:277 (-) Transcript_12650:280-1110(-)
MQATMTTKKPDDVLKPSNSDKKSSKKRERKEEKKKKKSKKRKQGIKDETKEVLELPAATADQGMSTDGRSNGDNEEDNTDSKIPLDRASKLNPIEEEQAVPTDDDPSTTTAATATNELQSLEKEYRDALKAFKADKTNKDLRRSKTAAKRAWDAALIASSGPDAEPLTCRNCSQLFIFTDHGSFKHRGWVRPTQCKECTYKISMSRAKDRSHRDQKQNMCYEFQKTGSCSRGDRCKFSHAKDHVGKTKPLKPICFAFEKGEPCPHGDRCRYRHEKE